MNAKRNGRIPDWNAAIYFGSASQFTVRVTVLVAAGVPEGPVPVMVMV